MFILLCLFLVSKVVHLVHVGSILGGDIDQFRVVNPEVIANYPPPADSTPDAADTGKENLKVDCYLVIGQYFFVMLVIAVALLLTRKTNYYIHFLPFMIAVVQLCELPFRPVFPIWYLLISAAWVFASYFFLTVLSFQTLYQAVPILLILLVGLPLRLYLLIDVEYIPYGYLAVFVVLTFAIAVMISIDVVSSAKLVFK